MEAQKQTVDINAMALDFLDYIEGSYPNTLQYIYWEIKRGYKFTSLQADLIKQTAQYLHKHGSK